MFPIEPCPSDGIPDVYEKHVSCSGGVFCSTHRLPDTVRPFATTESDGRKYPGEIAGFALIALRRIQGLYFHPLIKAGTHDFNIDALFLL